MNELEQHYIGLYRCMVEKDVVSLSFVLAHMTGMQQDKQSFLHSIENGTLNYYATIHETLNEIE